MSSGKAEEKAKRKCDPLVFWSADRAGTGSVVDEANSAHSVRA